MLLCYEVDWMIYMFLLLFGSIRSTHNAATASKIHMAPDSSTVEWNRNDRLEREQFAPGCT